LDEVSVPITGISFFSLSESSDFLPCRDVSGLFVTTNLAQGSKSRLSEREKKMIPVVGQSGSHGPEELDDPF
jgi:hypothetical protein